MNAQHSAQAAPHYLLLFRGTDWHLDMSPDEIAATMGSWNAWFDGLGAAGKLVGGNPLENRGKIVTGAARTVADGPFAESKESIGGYFLLRVDTMDEALEIAKNCPALPYGIEVEVRPVAPRCPVDRMLDDVAPEAALEGVKA